ncbi:uncharacterized protein A1O5_13082 [Cladophialophora psammophila CBS 110553]|uniref:Major facilitator superfamily (MFS) profile domain-containing protein n=1 Tax=Cladophialophora psammophila CBS 110553 TaxID=1182543 RepID=W9VNC3_9EURO|nr:uncharacterized protein A1O5_13082 [Cladophialophora psammophila CBS 110553]EXJ53631.1 hypothetical protein A1O5_13082 [Cladophialophora psammophila CBS 110553]
MRLWKHGFTGKTLVFAVTAASCQAFLLLGYDQVGCVVGSLITYFIGERLGRRTLLIMGGSIMIVGTAILASSITIAQLIVGRIVTGVGNGMNSSTAPVFLSECSPASHRGLLNTLQGTVTILGVVIAYWLDYGLSFTDSSIQWRFPLAFQAMFAIFLVLQVIGLPETPRWLVQHDRYEEARSTIAALLGKHEDDEQVTRLVLDIRSVVEEEQKGGPFKIRELFSVDKTQNLRRLLLTNLHPGRTTIFWFKYAQLLCSRHIPERDEAIA